MMKRTAHLLRYLPVLLLIATLGAAQQKPEIQVSPNRMRIGGAVILTGKGFTPYQTAMSHLLRPDGTQYNPLRVHTDGDGGFLHKIDTTMLEAGNYEIWVDDEVSKAVSNRVQFTVEP